MAETHLHEHADPVEIQEFSPDDRDALRGWVEVTNAVRRAETPWVHPITEHEATGRLRYGWDLEPEVPLLGTADGVPVAAGTYCVSEHDNLHLAWLSLDVHPDHRKQGHGSALLADLERVVASRGRTSVGLSCWEAVGSESFALERGYERKQVTANRRQYLAEIDPGEIDRIHADAAARAADYELVRRIGITPDDEHDALAVMTAAINDAPTDDLDIEDEVFDAERIRDYEIAWRDRGCALHRLLARHRDTGELAGQTVVVVDLERPELAEQHDTSVLSTHRGHRLGALLKTGMLQWLREEQPQVAEIDTWNSQSNDFMIGVNEALGYRVMGREFNLQKSL